MFTKSTSICGDTCRSDERGQAGDPATVGEDDWVVVDCGQVKHQCCHFGQYDPGPLSGKCLISKLKLRNWKGTGHFVRWNIDSVAAQWWCWRQQSTHACNVAWQTTRWWRVSLCDRTQLELLDAVWHKSDHYSHRGRGRQVNRAFRQSHHGRVHNKYEGFL